MKTTKINHHSALAVGVAVAVGIGLVLFFGTHWTLLSILSSVGVFFVGYGLHVKNQQNQFPLPIDKQRVTLQTAPQMYPQFSEMDQTWKSLPTVTDMGHVAVSNMWQILQPLYQYQQTDAIKLLREFFFPLLFDIQKRYQLSAGYYSQRRLVELLTYELGKINKAIANKVKPVGGSVSEELMDWDGILELVKTSCQLTGFYHDKETYERLLEMCGGSPAHGSIEDGRESYHSPETMRPVDRHNFKRRLEALGNFLTRIVDGDREDDMTISFREVAVSAGDVFFLGDQVLYVEDAFTIKKNWRDTSERNRYWMRVTDLLTLKSYILKAHIYQGVPKVFLGNQISSNEFSAFGNRITHSLLVSNRGDGFDVDYKGKTFKWDGGYPMYRKQVGSPSLPAEIEYYQLESGSEDLVIIVEQGAIKFHILDQQPDNVEFTFFNLLK